ncbi:RsmB/NOP family class I SAM-dependent RNA methyltransferase [Sinomonas terrae]|uniref:rRNA small subunit methyltransferase B n=1 Tax=Sinomonas terrae TaxID=2908838 RepID=A0ABS9U1G0_9MICC|nr:transcription antitermination factor NusB [Sinomonas terrae]MCH6470538.1 rRNA small subunit methyltransferase B [Sinomonas terrae]
MAGGSGPVGGRRGNSGQRDGGQGDHGQGRGGREHGQRRNEQGRERNRGGSAPRRFSQQAPSQRSRTADSSRLVAFEVLRAVSRDDAYANLVLPARIRHHHLDRRDAAFATELAYGALRGQGMYDAILARCVDRPLDRLDPAVLDVLRLGAHQLLAMRVPPHAALNQTVALARAVVGAGPGSLVNAVLRRASGQSLGEWLDGLTAGADETEAAAIRHAHPSWIVRALRQSLVAHGRPSAEIEALLEADNAAPVVNLVALPGIGSLEEALEEGATLGELVEDSALSSGGDLGRWSSVRNGTLRVQDVGSQLVARAVAAVPVTQQGVAASANERWLDLCAGPGGKAALLGALAEERGAFLLANEPAEHRADLVRQALRPVPGEAWSVRTGDGRTLAPELQGTFSRVIVDVPCSGLGALRRRPESRWRRTPEDIAELGPLQRELLDAAIDAAAPGGVVGYVTCSPHPAETVAVVEDALRRRTDIEELDAAEALDTVALRPLGAGHERTAQLWPHVHGTDAMFLALFRKRPALGGPTDAPSKES